MYKFSFSPDDLENLNAVAVARETDEIFMDDLVKFFEQFCLGLTFDRDTVAKGFIEWLSESEYLVVDDE